MPYPSQMNRESIIETAREMIELHGSNAVTVRLLAKAIGVKAPSLYRHIKNKDELLIAVNEVTITELIAVMMEAVEGDAPLVDRLVHVALAYRQYAHDHPRCYGLAMGGDPETMPDNDLRLQLVLPLQALFVQLTSEDDSLVALRSVFAFLHGWVSLEISQQFQRGGDLDAHFEHGFRAFLDGWQR
ncbi:MAG: TetR/AcrR family transcriptional regulator [Chloroflexota bacterium]